MKPKDMDSVRNYFSRISDLDRAVEEELIGTSMLKFIRDYTTFSCSGHVIDKNLGFIVTYPRIHFAYANTAEEAIEFHKRLTSVTVEYNGELMDFKVSPEKVQQKIAMMFGGKQNHIEEKPIEANKVMEYALYSRDGKAGYNDHNSVRILEDFWEKYSEVLSHFLAPEVLQKRRISHKIEEGFLITPFSLPPNRPLKIQDQY